MVKLARCEHVRGDSLRVRFRIIRIVAKENVSLGVLHLYLVARNAENSLDLILRCDK